MQPVRLAFPPLTVPLWLYEATITELCCRSRPNHTLFHTTRTTTTTTTKHQLLLSLVTATQVCSSWDRGNTQFVNASKQGGIVSCSPRLRGADESLRLSCPTVNGGSRECARSKTKMDAGHHATKYETVPSPARFRPPLHQPAVGSRGDPLTWNLPPGGSSRDLRTHCLVTPPGHLHVSAKGDSHHRQKPLLTLGMYNGAVAVQRQHHQIPLHLPLPPYLTQKYNFHSVQSPLPSTTCPS